jgi:hypothetical protein
VSVDDEHLALLQRTSGYWRLALDRFQESVATQPDPHTDYALDEAIVSGRNGTYSQSVGLITNAFDALLTLNDLWLIPKCHVPADYVLLRSAFENTVRAEWLLYPDDTAVRLIHAWTLARRGPARALRSTTTMVKRNPSRPARDELITTCRNAKDAVRAIDEEFGSAGVDIKTELESDTTALAEEIETREWYIDENNPDAGAVRFWFDLSGLAHGERGHVERLMSVNQTIGHVRLSSPNLQKLTQAAGLITQFLDQSLMLYYQRSDHAGLGD